MALFFFFFKKKLFSLHTKITYAARSFSQLVIFRVFMSPFPQIKPIQFLSKIQIHEHM